MANVRGCNLPDDLLYDVENHIWYQEMPDGNVKLGMTTVATGMAGQLVAYTPKKVGRSVDAGKACATVESGKCPDDYLPQVQGGLWVTGREWCDFVSFWEPTHDLCVVRVQRDETFIARLEAECAAVWAEVIDAQEKAA